MATGGSLGRSDHGAARFKIFANGRKTASKTLTVDMRRADFRLLKELRSKIPWEEAFEGFGMLFNCHLLKAQDWAIPKC